MATQIPPDAKSEILSLTRDLDMAACCLADDRVPRLPPEDVRAFVENAERIYVFKFERSARYTEMSRAWELLKMGGTVFLNADLEMVRYIFNAFRYYDRLAALIRKGAGCGKPANLSQEVYWTINTKAPAAALACAGVNVTDEVLTRMIVRDSDRCGYLMLDPQYDRAFLDPEAFCKATPDSPLAAIVAGFFHRERLRDFVNGMPARHVFREIDENGKEKISFIAEPVSKEIPHAH